ncbi:phosphate uptake regulator PhoU [Pyrofollis japonicus]|uniref:phosphate signaling complex PhoU family protein n=1 Tax=Pyrofollis japonicus TaxID=3060460 RepID=UPI00295B8554|nr:PhoU domain-containing protein [Pyrofollis japonicus]BEP17179.1 phosphate uptake regulator PhoU [Pyrofollis japonicus]
MTTAPTAEEDLEHIESTLRKLFKIAMESLEAIANAIEEAKPLDLSANTALAEHLKDTIYTETLFFIAKWQPLGHELLYAEALIKVSYDLFRITRYANEIALTISLAPGEKINGEVLEVAKLAKNMVERAFYAFVEKKRGEAREVQKLDEQIDQAYRARLKKVASHKQVPRNEALACIVLRQLERVADHATYIAREVERAIAP